MSTVPNISANRNFDNKSLKEVLNELEKKSFAEEIENDKEKSAVFINRVKQAKESNADTKTIAQEEAAAGVYKRALIMLGSSDMKIHNEASTKDAADNNLPVSSYLSHGSRTLIEVPAGSGDKLMNWLTSGDQNKNGLSFKQTQQEAIKEGKIVYNRSAATHDVSIQQNSQDPKKGFKLKEKKGFLIGVKDFLANKILGTKTKHFGVDLAMDAEFNGKDSIGKIVSKPDGDHGHLYIHYTSPKNNKPGSLLIGLEGAAPSSSKHSKTGASDPISATGGTKFDELVYKQQIAGENEYKNTLIPQKHQGITVKLDNDKLNALVKINDKDYSTELAYAKPATHPDEFIKKLNNQDYHQSPKLQAAIESDLTKNQFKKPDIFKRFANTFVKIITVGAIKPYEKEIAQYKKQKKILQIQEPLIKKNYNKDNLHTEQSTDSLTKRTHDVSVKVDNMMSKIKDKKSITPTYLNNQSKKESKRLQI